MAGASAAAAGAAAVHAPTGCFKCGKQGHWSRDCTVDVTKKPAHLSDSVATAAATNPKKDPPSKQQQKTRKVTRAKLTADVLLSEKGLGYVLEKVPQMVRIKGPGHEVEDLDSFFRAYRDWHAKLFPGISFKHFIAEVEDLGCLKRVRTCLEDLRDKVSNGVDLKACSSNFESQEDVDHEVVEPRDDAFDEDARELIVDSEEHLSEQFLRDSVEEVSQSALGEVPAAKRTRVDQSAEELQKARMEANRLKALERARARAAAASLNS